jgi:hypothetical protein
MILLQGNALFSTSRDSVDSPFNRPKPITELGEYKLISPCISEDGLTLYFDQFKNSRRISFTSRVTRDSKWGEPHLLYGLEDHSLRQPYVTSDGRMLVAINSEVDSKEQCNVTVFSRDKPEGPFHLLGLVDCSALRQGGMFPRYCSSTGELFIALVPEGKTDVDLAVVKNFSLIGMMRKDAE